MFSLFFGDLYSTLSTIFLFAILGYIVFTAVKHKDIKKWGWRMLILVITGLTLCLCVCIRDGYVDAVQGGSGFFAMQSPQINLAYIGGTVIAFTVLFSIFVRNQRYRKAMFFILSSSIIFKAVLIEASKILM